MDNMEIDIGDKVLILLPKESISRKLPANIFPENWNNFLYSHRIVEVEVISKKIYNNISYLTILFPKNCKYGYENKIRGRKCDSVLNKCCLKCEFDNKSNRIKCFNCDKFIFVNFYFEGFYCYECGY